MSEDRISLDKWFAKKISLSIGSGLIIIVILSLSVFTLITIRRHIEKNTFEEADSGLEISTMIRNVKHELFKADSLRIANNEGALFQLRDFQMEISFAVRKVSQGGVNMGYKFVTVEGGSEMGNEKVQKLILHWDAVEQKLDTVFLDTTEEDIITKPLN